MTFIIYLIIGGYYGRINYKKWNKNNETKLTDCYIIKPNVQGDHRGWFMEVYSEKVLKEVGLNYHFVQRNRSFTQCKNTIRGLHFQKEPKT